MKAEITKNEKGFVLTLSEMKEFHIVKVLDALVAAKIIHADSLLIRNFLGEMKGDQK
jgi:hypothetical protein